MKKYFILLSSLFLFILNSQAQITINADDIAPIGVVAEQTVDSNPDPSILEGGVGEMSWDFSALQEGTSSTFVFMDPAETPYPLSFPSANLASELDGSIYAYMTQDDNKIEILGLEGDLEYSGLVIETKLDVVPGQSLIRFPATYNESYTETVDQIVQVEGALVGFPTFDSVRNVANVQRFVEIDAYGSLTLPNGTFETLRSTELEVTANTVFVYTNDIWTFLQETPADTVINYNWWTNDNGLGYPVVQLVFTPSNGDREVTWLKEFVTSTDESFAINVNLFPSPASHTLNLELPEIYQGKYELYDLKGHKVKSGNIASNTESIDIKNINNGFYVLLLKDENGMIRASKKFEIFR